jgi:two-component system, NarL family, sensor histidine kinase UhpB
MGSGPESEQRAQSSEERMVAAMRDSAARLNGIIQSAMDAIITVDDRQDIVIFNPAAEEMFGCAAENVLGTPLDQFIPGAFREAHRRHVERFGATGVTRRRMAGQSEITGLRANGDEFPVEASISQVMVGGKRLFTVILRDITRRKRSERELQESQAQLRQLSGALQSVREEEKARIARELHDELGQALTGLKMDLAELMAQLRPEQAEAVRRGEAMRSLLDSTVASVRRIATELRPLMLDDLGLIPTIEWLVNDFSQRTGIAIELSLPGPDLEVDADRATGIFRVLQESLTNVARHAEASRVQVRLSASEHTIRLVVHDNGKGIDPSVEREVRTLGLLGMRERAAMLGGELTLESSRDAGTTIAMSVARGGAG